jgi:hypothetical protein
VTFEWVRRSDIDRERRRRESTERLKARRAEAVRRIEVMLGRMGSQPMARPGGALDAYATVVSWRDAKSTVHSVAIHPAPGVLAEAVKRLAAHDAVVVDDEDDRRGATELLQRAGGVVSSAEFIERIARRDPPPRAGRENRAAPATDASSVSAQAPARTGRRRSRLRSWIRRRRR